MDTSLAIAMYAQETGYLVRGLLVLLAIAIVALSRAAYLAGSRGAKLRQAERDLHRWALQYERARRVLAKSRQQSVQRMRWLRRTMDAAQIQGAALTAEQAESERLRGELVHQIEDNRRFRKRWKDTTQ